MKMCPLEMLPDQDNRQFSPKIGGFHNRLFVPGTQTLNYRILLYAGLVGHVWRSRCVFWGFQSRAPFFQR